ncbi:MAG: carboxypeptidase regulatory-like domain-containing protein, partial [Bacteroidales bacterium]|nr:carboxypeptidase regulatory-like domain-containing protein [Bacteroidales bacterium]
MANSIFAQQMGTLRGTITDAHGQAVALVSVSCAESNTSSLSKDNGTYQIEIPLNKPCTVYFNKIGYHEHAANVTLTTATKIY